MALQVGALDVRIDYPMWVPIDPTTVYMVVRALLETTPNRVTITYQQPPCKQDCPDCAAEQASIDWENMAVA
jgi:hypothetical protein